MKIDLALSCPIQQTPRVVQIAGMFDVPVAERSTVELHCELPLHERPWHVGLIVGPSGSGKTSLARKAFGEAYITKFDWPADKSILDGFPDLGIKRISGLLSAVGFGSVPNWLRPFHVLSNGEQFRATVARALAEKPQLAVVDEFTSVVDRQVAKVAAHCVAKTVRRSQRQFVGVSCHYDIIDWLQPDWVYEPHLGAFEWRSLQRRPEVSIEIRTVNTGVWSQFSKYHYLSSKLSPQACCVGGFLGNQCIAFASAMRWPDKNNKRLMEIHRTVALPEYQGLGLALRLSDWIAGYLWERGWDVHARPAHPAVVAYRNRSPRWQMLNHGMPKYSPGGSMENHRRRFSAQRAAATFKYMAPAGSTRPRHPQPVNDLRAAVPLTRKKTAA
jgi:hypothetical protein